MAHSSSTSGTRDSFWATVRRDASHLISGTLYVAPRPLTWRRWMYVLLQPEFWIVFRYRVAHYWTRKGGVWRLLGYLYYLRNKWASGCDIHPEARIGPGLRIVHCSDVVIGPAVVIGSDVVLFNSTTLGNRHVVTADNAMPRLGDRVVVGAGGRILGGITIGDGAMIGANAVVLQSVPAGAVAVGVPATVRMASQATVAAVMV